MGYADQTRESWIKEQLGWIQNKTEDINNTDLPKKEVQCMRLWNNNDKKRKKQKQKNQWQQMQTSPK